jgi:hypothetical protein
LLTDVDRVPVARYGLNLRTQASRAPAMRCLPPDPRRTCDRCFRADRTATGGGQPGGRPGLRQPGDWLTSGLLRVEVTDSGGGTPRRGRCRTRPVCTDAPVHRRQALRRMGSQLTTGPRHERMFHGHSQHRCGLSSLSASEHRSRASSGQVSQPAVPWGSGRRTRLPQRGRRISPNDLPAARELARSAGPATPGRGQTTRMTGSELTLGWLPAS